ncbi:tRNA (adenosine(37)-N6)-threonylcarbamoyltransferase complex ATPase subunit type 1 TsaE [Cohnella cholangitidis]|uniref:tRNA threonylcarbamoyladenosine biosynthesis protein TsaE n=1 Tax=Cohnella cholangitidis TaxID=2598458 RepID=A0A7G5C220_9BACL|nr:tRNA (adenosine(37)-N6)-threonylcarbamoyltransferase complex ATPase subunit type 1 TsaE [Cohnella cholangitidis]QMV43254.1 tRNA (adenosine(37)-N6)-threonylcarbamoyltransferase complex ATPase subunit type 1 TsaE [Cohnella cholangitidis]
MQRNETSGSKGNYVLEAATEISTVQFAEALAKFAGPGDVIALDGDLGAGKTRFAKAYAAAIGVEGIVNSPTYTIIKEYEGAKFPFYHMDVYRLSLEEADELGLDEYFHGSGVTLVEWASLIEPILPPERLHLFIETTGPESRTIACRPVGRRYELWCRELELKPIEKEEPTA